MTHKYALEKTMCEIKKVADAVYKVTPEKTIHILNRIYVESNSKDLSEKYRDAKRELIASIKRISFINYKVRINTKAQIIPVFRNKDQSIKKIEELNTEEMLTILKEYIKLNVKPLTKQEEEKYFN